MLPVLFKVGPLTVHSWGLLLMAGFLLAAWRAARNAERYKITAEHIWDVALWGLLGGILGARFAFVLQNLQDYRANPLAGFAIWTGGMTFYGGLVGGVLAGVLVCRMRKISILDTADLAALAFPIGYAVGRIGCFLNGCCYGGACPPPLGMRFHTADGLTEPSHPAQLYSAGAGLLMYLLLSRLEPRRRFPGQLMAAFLFLYGVYRFFVEFVREGVTAETTALFGLTTGQIASMVLAAVAVMLFILGERRVRRERERPHGTGSGPAARTQTSAQKKAAAPARR